MIVVRIGFNGINGSSQLSIEARRARKSRAKNSGGAAGGGAAPEQARPKAELTK